MKRAFLRLVGVVLLWSALANSCPAVLGENERQLEQRYGKSIPELTDHLGPLVVRMYLVRGTFVTFVMLHRGRSVCEGYTRADKQPLSEHSVSAMLKGNARDEKCREIFPGRSVNRQWTLGKKAAALYFADVKHPGIMVYEVSWLPYALGYMQTEKPGQNKSVRR